MFGARFGRGVGDVIAIKSESAEFIAIILAGNCQDRQCDLFELLGRRHHCVVVGVGGRMLQDALKIDRGIPNERIESLECDVLPVGIQKFCAPKLLVSKKIVLTGAPAGKSEPLHVVGFANIIKRGIIERRVSSGCRNDRRQMRWKFFRRGPLIETCIGTTPHCHFAVAEGLLRKPFHDVMPIARLLRERLELTTGISATANIDKRKCITVRREIRSAGVVRVGNVRRQRENDWRL